MDNELFKLRTRRYLAWGVGGLAVLVIGFIAVWGAVQGMTELVTLAGGILATTLGAVTGYYFSTKISEE